MAGEVINLSNQALTANNIVPNIYTGTTQGTFVDMSSAKILTQALILMGTFTANTTSVSVQLEECSTTNGTFTKIPDLDASAKAICTITASNTFAYIQGLRTSQYCRLNALTVTGTTASVYMAGALIEQLEFTGTGGGYTRSPSS